MVLTCLAGAVGTVVMASEGAISVGPAEQDTCNSPNESAEFDPLVGSYAQK